MSMSAWVVFKWLYLPLTSKQLTAIHHTMQLADEFDHGFSYFVGYVEVKMVQMDAIGCLQFTLPPCKSASGTDHVSKNYLKWWAIHLVIHSIVNEQTIIKRIKILKKN